MNTIEAIHTSRYQIILAQIEKQHNIDYVIQYRLGEDEDYKTSEYVKDLNTAYFMFNSKLQELEGN